MFLRYRITGSGNGMSLVRPPFTRTRISRLTSHVQKLESVECRVLMLDTDKSFAAMSSIHSWIVVRVKSESLAAFPYRMRTNTKTCSRFQRAVCTPPSVLPRCLS